MKFMMLVVLGLTNIVLCIMTLKCQPRIKNSMTAMMIAMMNTTISGFMIAYIIGMPLNNFIAAVILVTIFSLMWSVIFTAPLGFMPFMEGVMGSIMGGMMGTMLVTMTQGSALTGYFISTLFLIIQTLSILFLTATLGTRPILVKFGRRFRIRR